MKNKFKDILHYPISFIAFISFISFFFAGCEKDISIVIPEGEEDVVVYGAIEQDLPPFIILTKSLPVFATNDIETIQNSFVHNAIIKISDGNDTVQLYEYCLNEVEGAIKDIIVEEFDLFGAMQAGINFCVYSLDSNDYFSYLLCKINNSCDNANIFLGKTGKIYSLAIDAEGKKLSATTLIPQPIPLDSLWWMPHSDPKKDTLVVFWVRYTDPPGERNYARYFTKRNQEPFFPGYFLSVFNDELINGESFNFPLERGQDEDPHEYNDNGQHLDPSYGYFKKGDEIIIKWCQIDKAHYDFWRTLEVDKNSAGNPFGSPTKIISNIDGGLGIWGGYGAFYDTLVVK